MLRAIICRLVACCSGVLTACTTPGPEYRFTPEQLAWQPYREGQVLRFGNSRTADVRTYRVTRVLDLMIVQSGGWGLKPLPHQEPPSFQSVTAFMQRTDSMGVEFTAFGLSFDTDHPPVVPGSELLVTAALGWDDISPSSVLPVDELNQALPLDTTRYGKVQLLPLRMLGPATYASLVHYSLSSYRSLFSPATELYVTKPHGIVGFVERRTLWYRLP